MSFKRAGHRELLGEVIGTGWVLDSVIGAGGTATVYRARARDGRSAAVKLMHDHLYDNWSRRFEREAQLLSKLREPSVVEIYEFGRRSGVPFLVLELLHGASLDRVALPESLKLRTQRVLELAKQALRPLAAVHARGVLHRDLKPSNLFLTSEGMLKILDFGAACSEQSDVLKPDSLTSGLLGTPAFMSPEQALGRWDLVDERSDIWSLGAVIFTLLSGAHVHPASTRNEQLGRAMSCSARSIATLLPELDASMVRALDLALSYRREDRFQCAAEFLAALDQRTPCLKLVTTRADDGTLTEPLNRSRAGLTRRAWARAPAALYGIAAGILALGMAYHRFGKPPQTVTAVHGVKPSSVGFEPSQPSPMLLGVANATVGPPTPSSNNTRSRTADRFKARQSPHRAPAPPEPPSAADARPAASGRMSAPGDEFASASPAVFRSILDDALDRRFNDPTVNRERVEHRSDESQSAQVVGSTPLDRRN